MNLRASLVGGRSEGFSFISRITHDANGEQDTEILYKDFTSMYPSVMFEEEMSVGHPEVIMKPPWIPGTRTFPYRGYAHVKVLPPPKGSLPFGLLPYRVEQKKPKSQVLAFPLCGACCRAFADPPCEHSEEERTFEGMFTTIELQFAMDHGYQVLEVFEVYHWTTWSRHFYRDFMAKLVADKTMASGDPETLAG